MIKAPRLGSLVFVQCSAAGLGFTVFAILNKQSCFLAGKQASKQVHGSICCVLFSQSIEVGLASFHYIQLLVFF